MLHDLWLGGAFQGNSANQAYFARSKEDMHSSEDVEEGRLNLEVGFAAERPAEFYVRRITSDL